MSFFAGAFRSPGSGPIHFAHPGIRRALRVDRGASIWRAVSSDGALAHSQTIVTPEDRFERLPLSFERGRKVLVFDGRLDNREELIRSLHLPAGPGAITDSAIVAAAISRWEEKAFAHLLGDFALACVDIPGGRLLLASDQVGGRTVLYSADPESISFSTSFDSMLNFPGVPTDVDMNFIARLLIDALPERGRTAFRHVQQLPAAHYLIWSPRGLELKRYWTLDPANSIRYRDETQYVDHARELLDTAVRCRLRAVGPIACQLSGGFDSSGVTATAAKLIASERVFSITAVPERHVPLYTPSRRVFLDEWDHAAAVAKLHPNIEAHRVCATLPHYEDPRRLFQARGMPVRNFLNLSWFESANQRVRDIGARVLLNGSSGNATLSWAGIDRLPELAASGRLFTLLREAYALGSRGMRSPREILKQACAQAFLSHRIRRRVGQMRRLKEPRFASSAISTELALALDTEAFEAEATDRTDSQGDYRQMRAAVLENMWRRPGRGFLRDYHGVERRDPLGDIRLVEFCMAIPSDQYMSKGVTRRLARRVLADRVPEQVLREDRVGRQNAEWFHRLTHMRPRLAAVLQRLEGSPLARYALDLSRMKAILDKWPVDADAAQPNFGPLVCVLARGVNVGEFLEWAESGCVNPTATRHGVLCKP